MIDVLFRHALRLSADKRRDLAERLLASVQNDPGDGRVSPHADLPEIDQRWPSGELVRHGAMGDAAVVARWSLPSAPGRCSLGGILGALGQERENLVVYVVTTPVPVGLAALAAAKPYLELVHVIEEFRDANLEVRTLSIVIDDFFKTRTDESWIGVLRPVTNTETRFLRRLGFLEHDSEMRLTRSEWKARRTSLVSLF